MNRYHGTCSALLALMGAGAIGCSSTASSDNDGSPPSATPTYHRDVRPILEAKCTGCHAPGGIAPFAFTTADVAIQLKDAIADAVTSRRMPPWPPAPGCAELLDDRSLTDDQIDAIARWAEAGAPPGDPAEFVASPDMPGGLSRVDLDLSMPEPYTPATAPDEYRCFLIDWPYEATRFVTGLGVTPGAPSIVHHVVVFFAKPGAVETYEAWDAADPGPGYSCFGGPTGDDAAIQGPSAYGILGGWAPGSFGRDAPRGTGIEVPPGVKIVMQVHYNIAHGMPAPDQTRVALRIDDAVERPAYTMPWLDPAWVKGGMRIPAGDPDVMYDFEEDAATAVSLFTKGALPADQPFTLYTVGLHQHLRGKSISLSTRRGDGERECLVDIPRWDFHWQSPYGLAEPRRLAPGDRLRVECHWDNSAENQPFMSGVRMPPEDLAWGEGTNDEMCLAWLYVTP
ncbi:monooxygenase [Sorangium sp. So ce295]|uniref:monooxygenase n=1 Tax=Sorangium sp. So ce295 TaxID=3133295 RepID=UPI003F5E8F21